MVDSFFLEDGIRKTGVGPGRQEDRRLGPLPAVIGIWLSQGGVDGGVAAVSDQVVGRVGPRFSVF